MSAKPKPKPKPKQKGKAKAKAKGKAKAKARGGSRQQVNYIPEIGEHEWLNVTVPNSATSAAIDSHFTESLDAKTLIELSEELLKDVPGKGTAAPVQ